MQSKPSLIIILCGMLQFGQSAAYATVIASSSISISNLQINPASGTVIFLDPWSSTAFAEAQNSLGEWDAQFDSNIGGSALANATVTYANASGGANGLSLTANAGSNVFIPGSIEAAAAAIGRGTLFNSFMITGGVGDVNVTFSLGMIGALQVMTDQFGQLAETEVIVSLELDGDSVLYYRDHLLIGPSSSDMRTSPTALTGMRTLQFDAPYFLLAEADSESRGINTPIRPVPDGGSTLSLLGTALTGLAAWRRKSSAPTSKT